MAPPRKSSKRRRGPQQPRPTRARPPGAGARPPVPEPTPVEETPGPEAPALGEVDAPTLGEVDAPTLGEVDAPPTLGEVDAPPTLEEVDLLAGAPPEDLGAATTLPPDDDPLEDEPLDDDLGGAELGDDELGVEELTDDDLAEEGEAVADGARPVAVAAALPARSREDELDAEDELLPAARNARGRAASKPGGNRVVAFLQASWAELQRVQWPDRRQVGQATAVVLGFVVIAGGYLGLADLVSQSIVDAIL